MIRSLLDFGRQLNSLPCFSVRGSAYTWEKLTPNFQTKLWNEASKILPNILLTICKAVIMEFKTSLTWNKQNNRKIRISSEKLISFKSFADFKHITLTTFSAAHGGHRCKQSHWADKRSTWDTFFLVEKIGK